jgi:protein-tyrosine kinase
VSVADLQSAFLSWTQVRRWKRPLNSASEIFERRQSSSTEWSGPVEKEDIDSRLAFDSERFSSQQVLGLVRQVFLGGWPQPARQVVFCAVDEGTEIAGACGQVATALAREVSSDVCLVEAAIQEGNPTLRGQHVAPRSTNLHTVAGQLCSNLWRVPQDVFVKRESERSAVAGTCRGLEELKKQFEYSVIQAPAAGAHRQAALLGQLCDGVVLVLQANSTRRLAAQKTKEMLAAAQVQVLGTILCDRTFPIPESLYRRL